MLNPFASRPGRFSLALVLFTLVCATSVGHSAQRWWKGNLHTHSLWSDGDDYPEMIAAWYKDNGYHLLSFSDHNVLLEGEKWIQQPVLPEQVIQAA